MRSFDARISLPVFLRLNMKSLGEALESGDRRRTFEHLLPCRKQYGSDRLAHMSACRWLQRNFFLLFAAGATTLLAMWVLFGVHLFGGGN
jgi:hypothetical protein